MASDGFNWILPFRPVKVRLVPLKTQDFKGLGPDFTGLQRISTGLHEIWLKTV